MNFVGRQRELDFLTAEYEADRGSFVPIYGRRRVGKSQLLVEFLESRDGMYFLGTQSPPELQLREFMVAAAAALDEPLVAEITPNSWKHALATVASRWRGPGKFAIILDEFQWTATASPELQSVLQGLWDQSWRDGNIMLVLCGSYIGFMTREVLGSESPLFGRRTGQIHLKPFGYLEARDFHPELSVADCARIRFVCGGIPAYLRLFSPNRSFSQNIREQILGKFAPLHGEVDFLLREELREVTHYHAILMVLARGSRPLREIAKQTNIASGSLPYYLNQLVELGYLRRRHPVDGRPPVKRHVRYALEDPLLRFWFRFVFGNQSLLAQSGPDALWTQRIQPDLESWCGSGFEVLCREALPHIYRKERVLANIEIGEYWSKKVQIDVVGARDDSWIDLGECKWGRVNSAPRLVDELRSKRARFPNPTGASIGLRAFVRDGPAQDEGGVQWHDLEGLYSLQPN